MTFKRNSKASLPDCLACVHKFVMTSKSIRLNETLGKVTLHVTHIATKNMVKRALEAMFDIKISGLAVINVKGERKVTKRGMRTTPSYKKVIATVDGGNFRVSDILAESK